MTYRVMTEHDIPAAVSDAMHEHFYGKLGYQNAKNLVLKSKFLDENG